LIFFLIEAAIRGGITIIKGVGSLLKERYIIINVFSCYVCYLSIYKASKVQKSKNRFVRADVLFAELASDFGGELVVGGGPFREPPTVMQSTVGCCRI